MELHHYEIDAGRLDRVRIVPLGDIHWGVANCAEGLVRDWVERIRQDPSCWWIGMGDMLEAINFSDRRFDPRSISGRYRITDLRDLPMLQARELVQVLEPIADRCIGWHTGNHEETILLKYHEDVTGWICRQLGLYHAPGEREEGQARPGQGSYLENNALTRLVIRRKGKANLIYRLYSEHGRQAARTPGTALNGLLKLAGNFEADIYLRGHVHQRVGVVQPRLRLSDATWGRSHRAPSLSLIDWDQVFCLTGTFYRTYQEGATSYAEQRSYAPTALGPVVLELDVGTGRVLVY